MATADYIGFPDLHLTQEAQERQRMQCAVWRVTGERHALLHSTRREAPPFCSEEKVALKAAERGADLQRRAPLHHL